jgi:hypothetical protein
MKRWLLALCTLTLAACQPANPPPTPLPTKEKTIDRVEADVDKAMKQAEDIRKADEARDGEDPMKKGY